MVIDATPPARLPLLTVIQSDRGVPLGRFEDWLGTAQMRLVRAYDGEPVPTSLDAVGDGLLVLGGRMSAVDDAAAGWLPATRALLASAAASGVPALGICLGAQLLALATGGKVQVAAPPGVEAGVIDVRWRPEAAGDPLLAGLAGRAHADGLRSTRMLSLHADAVVDLPTGAAWLASSPVYPYQVFRVGSAWGVQFHPEARVADARAWADGAGVDPESIGAAMAAHDEELATAGQILAEAFVDRVRAGRAAYA